MSSIKRPNLRGVCAVVDSIRPVYPGNLYIKLTESGGFDILKVHEEGSVLIEIPRDRKQVRKALDKAEQLLHERRREISKAITEAE